MATMSVEVLVAPAPFQIHLQGQTDRPHYGWRYVRHERDDGIAVMEQIPLTLENVLHPQEGDQVVRSNAHQRRVRYLCDVLEAQLAGDPTAVVLDDVLIAWDHPDVQPHGPDVAVILSVRERKNWSTFDVAQEGVRPALIIELTSPEIASLDRSNKLEEYDIVGVPLYVIVDSVATRRAAGLRLLAYAQSPEGYQVLPPDERGWIWLEPVRVWLSVENDEIVCRDSDGRPLGGYRELAKSLESAEERIRELEEELSRLRGQGGVD